MIQKPTPSQQPQIEMLSGRGKIHRSYTESEEIQKRCEEDLEKHCFRYLDMIKPQRVKRMTFYLLLFTCLFLMVFQFAADIRQSSPPVFKYFPTNESNTMIIVITPTYKRLTRYADMLRMANTLSHVKNLHWIVVEDGNFTRKPVEDILKRTNLPYTYLAYKTIPGYPRRGWYQRTMALTYLRANASRILGNHESGVVYFGDDDNSYDIRLFTDYIRNVRVLGMWAVGLVGGTAIEAPHVENGKVTRFDVRWMAKRVFAIDMAGFAVNLNVVLNSGAVFGKSCTRGHGAPETCLLEDLGLKRDDIEPFGFDKKEDREVYVWHTKTSNPNLSQHNKKKDSKVAPPPIDKLGFLVEV